MTAVLDRPVADLEELLPLPEIELESAPVPPASARVPLLLGLMLAVASACLAFVEMSQPGPQATFGGVEFVNKIRSPGSRQAVALFRDGFSWLPFDLAGTVLSPTTYLLGLRGSLVAMVALQVLAVAASLRANHTRLWPWLVGPVVSLVLLLAYPPVSTDVFSYSSFGWVWRIGHNPYLHAPEEFIGDPYARMNDWTHITTPYGPIWTTVSRLFVTATDASPFPTVLLFKVLIASGAVAMALIAYGFGKRLTGDPRRGVTAAVIVAWSPILLLESAGTAHNDAPMMALTLLGLWLTTRSFQGAYRTGIVVTAAGALIKPAAMPLLPFLALGRIVATSEPLRSVARRWLLDSAAVAGLVAVAFAPYYGDSMVSTMIVQQWHFYFTRPMRVNPVWTWVAPGLANIVPGRAAVDVVYDNRAKVGRILTVAALGLTIIVGIRAALASRVADNLDPTATRLRWNLRVWMVVAMALSLFPVNAHAWYAIWPLVPVAALWSEGSRTTRRWLGVYLGWTAVSFVYFHSGRIFTHPMPP